MLASVSTRCTGVLSAVPWLLLGGGLSAQTTAHLSAGVVFPAGDFAAIGDPGMALAGGLTVDPAGQGFTMGAEASYGRSVHASGDARSDVYSLTGLVGYGFGGLGPVEITPLAGLAGVVHARRSGAFPGLDATRGGVALSVGLRATVVSARITPYVAGSYLLGLADLNTAAFPTELATVTAGVVVPLGG